MLVGKRAVECGLDREIGVCWTRGSCGGSVPPSAEIQALAEATLSCPSGHTPWKNLAEGRIDKSVDGDLNTITSKPREFG